MSKIVTVFGSSMPHPGDEEYETAYILGEILGSKGISVCTGGYQGTMDAVSKGATKMGQNAIGVTVKTFSAIPSQFLTQEISTDSLFERIETLIDIGDGFIILRGGTGTLLEMAVLWEMINKRLLDHKPISCHGKMWKPFIETMDERMKFEGREHGLIHHSGSIENCADYIIERL